MAETLRQDFANEVRRVFEYIDYPGDEYFGSRGVESLKGHSWQEIPLENLVLSQWNLVLLPAQAYCYFLPAVLIAILLRREEASDLPEVVFFQLAPPTDEDVLWKHTFPEVVQLLNAEQRNLIYQFFFSYRSLFPKKHNLGLDLWKDAYERALQYWSQYRMDT